MDNYADILQKDPLELLEWLSETFSIDFPTRINSVEEMSIASEKLLQLTGYHAYLCELLSYAKIAVRQAKRDLSKTEWEDYVDKQNAIDRRLDIVKQQYNAISRAITVKTESNKELFMSMNTQ